MIPNFHAVYILYVYIYIYIYIIFRLYSNHVPRLSPHVHNLNCTFNRIENAACCTHTYTHKVKNTIMLMKKLHTLTICTCTKVKNKNKYFK